MVRGPNLKILLSSAPSPDDLDPTSVQRGDVSKLGILVPPNAVPQFGFGNVPNDAIGFVIQKTAVKHASFLNKNPMPPGL